MYHTEFPIHNEIEEELMQRAEHTPIWQRMGMMYNTHFSSFSISRRRSTILDQILTRDSLQIEIARLRNEGLVAAANELEVGDGSPDSNISIQFWDNSQGSNLLSRSGLVIMGRANEAGERRVRIVIDDGHRSMNWTNSVFNTALTTLLPLSQLSPPLGLAFVATKLLVDGLSTRH